MLPSRMEPAMNDRCYAVPPGLLSVEQALEFLLERALPVTETECVDTGTALGRVLAQTLCSPIDVPSADNSAMDGYAFAIADLARARSASLPVMQRIAAGAAPGVLVPGTAARIFTGAAIPRGADAVVMQECCTVDAQGGIVIAGSVKPGDHIRRAGEDIRAGSEVLIAGTRLRPQELGIAASIGVSRLNVVRRLRVALISTGDELAMPGTPLRPGQCYNANRYTVAGLLQALQCETVDYGIVADDPDATRAVLTQAAGDTDLILSTGGVSVGEEDHVKAAVDALGHLDLWRIAIKPGKPLAFGRIGTTPFIGLPGNPISALVTFLIFVRPFILRTQGVLAVAPARFPVIAAFDWPSGARREFLRARIEHHADSYRALLHTQQGSAVLTAAGWAHGLIDVPMHRAVSRGDSVHFIPFSELLQ